MFLDRDMEKPGAHFSKRTGCTPWFFRMSAGTKLNCAFNDSGLNSNNLKRKIAFFKGLHFYKRNFSDLNYKCS